MRANGMVEMDSYRLAAYTVPCPCYICGGGNNFDAELCRHCHAPMALAHQAASQKIHPRMLAAIGPSGAGKTVYLGMLSRYAVAAGRVACSCWPAGRFRSAAAADDGGPESRASSRSKTPNEPDRWHWVHCQVLRKKHKPAELIMPDLAGEALLEEVDHPNTFPGDPLVPDEVCRRAGAHRCSPGRIGRERRRLPHDEAHQLPLRAATTEQRQRLATIVRSRSSSPKPTSANSASKSRRFCPPAYARPGAAMPRAGQAACSTSPSAWPAPVGCRTRIAWPSAGAAAG